MLGNRIDTIDRLGYWRNVACVEAKALHSRAYVGIKAKTAEKLGFVGREEGISCDAVALIESA